MEEDAFVPLLDTGSGLVELNTIGFGDELFSKSFRVEEEIILV